MKSSFYIISFFSYVIILTLFTSCGNDKDESINTEPKKEEHICNDFRISIYNDSIKSFESWLNTETFLFTKDGEKERVVTFRDLFNEIDLDKTYYKVVEYKEDYTLDDLIDVLAKIGFKKRGFYGINTRVPVNNIKTIREFEKKCDNITTLYENTIGFKYDKIEKFLKFEETYLKKYYALISRYLHDLEYMRTRYKDLFEIRNKIQDEYERNRANNDQLRELAYSIYTYQVFDEEFHRIALDCISAYREYNSERLETCFVELKNFYNSFYYSKLSKPAVIAKLEEGPYILLLTIESFYLEDKESLEK